MSYLISSSEISTPTIIRLDKFGPVINVPVRYSKRAKRIIIRINSTGPELVMPNKNLDQGYNFLLNKEPWIRKNLCLKAELSDIDQNIIPLFGKNFFLSEIISDHQTIKINDSIINIYSQVGSHTDILIKFLQNKLLLEITSIINSINEKLDLYIHKIRLTHNKTKWGSCTSAAVLSFNWRLIFAPIEIVRYVIIHEMCHLIQMNHSKSFWKLVTSQYPDWKAARLWLRQNSNRLHQYCVI